MRGSRAQLNPRIFLLVLILALLAVNTAVVLMVHYFEARIGGGDIVVADRFMKAIELGSGVDPDGASRSGYEQAWDCLDPDCRAGRAYPDFLAFFERRISDHGYIWSWRRSPEESGSMGDRRLRYLVEYRDPEGQVTTVRYDLRVIRDRDDQYRVAAYSAELVPGESGR
ncbi:MAG: hypothetical protein H6807_13070 [Planctomycetes bacterium]|nr:hypothetical protein [Planctomycetota bacterium]